MNGEKILRMLLEFDQQVVSPRPSHFGEAARTVRKLIEHATTGDRLPDDSLLGDWRSVDFRQVDQRAPRDLHQPVVDSILATHTYK